MMQAALVPPPVVVGPSGLPASICTGLPEITYNNVRHCLFGLRVTGDYVFLEGARAKLSSQGWDAKINQISHTQYVLIVDAKGKDLPALQTVQDRIRAAEFGTLQVSAVSVPLPSTHR
jgi:hypothetical protein